MDFTQDNKVRELNLLKKQKEWSIILYFAIKYVSQITCQAWQMKKQYAMINAIKACTQHFFTVKEDLLKRTISTNDFEFIF